MRLQEWVAEEKGYFAEEGLDYEFVTSTGFTTSSVKSATELPKNQIRGAYQSIEDGRTCDISSACHWTVNMAAAAGHGRLWGGAYSMTPAGIFVAPDSKIRRPEDLANVPVTVGYQSGSHYTTIQALEPVLKREEIKVHFGGTLFLRLELLIDREVPVATLFSAPMYLAEQLGYRKILDCSFMTAGPISQKLFALAKQYIPGGVNSPVRAFRNVGGLSHEMIERLERARPANFAQVRNIPGLTPTALSTVLVHLTAASA